MFFKLCQAIFILEIGVASGKDMASTIFRACRSHLIERFAHVSNSAFSPTGVLIQGLQHVSSLVWKSEISKRNRTLSFP